MVLCHRASHAQGSFAKRIPCYLLKRRGRVQDASLPRLFLFEKDGREKGKAFVLKSSGSPEKYILS